MALSINAPDIVQWPNAPNARQVLGTDLEESYLSQTQGKRKVDGETMRHERKSKYEGHYGSLGYMLVRCKGSEDFTQPQIGTSKHFHRHRDPKLSS